MYLYKKIYKNKRVFFGQYSEYGENFKGQNFGRTRLLDIIHMIYAMIYVGSCQENDCARIYECGGISDVLFNLKGSKAGMP